MNMYIRILWLIGFICAYVFVCIVYTVSKFIETKNVITVEAVKNRSVISHTRLVGRFVCVPKLSCMQFDHFYQGLAWNKIQWTKMCENLLFLFAEKCDKYSVSEQAKERNVLKVNLSPSNRSLKRFDSNNWNQEQTFRHSEIEDVQRRHWVCACSFALRQIRRTNYRKHHYMKWLKSSDGNGRAGGWQPWQRHHYIISICYCEMPFS